MMQSHIIQFERLPAAGTDRCSSRQSAFCVAEPLESHSFQTLELNGDEW